MLMENKYGDTGEIGKNTAGYTLIDTSDMLSTKEVDKEMDNASLYYDETNSYEGIKNLIGIREDIFIDFKQTASRNGKLTDDDKANFAKAASGFAHQQGGVLIWGISTAIDNNEVSRATELKPIVRLEAFCSALHSFIRDSTEPPVDGIQHKIIHENDRKEPDVGFVASLFPQSYKVHRSLPGRTRNAFYKRHGDGFHELTTEEIRSLFFRSVSPDLAIHIARSKREQGYSSLRVSVENTGKGIAKNCSVYLGLASQDTRMKTCWNLGELQRLAIYGDDSISAAVQILEVHRSPKYRYHVKFNPGAFICPGEDVYVGTLWFAWANKVADVEITYKLLAENMIPKEESEESIEFS